MNHYINGLCNDGKVYQSDIEMLEDDWEVYHTLENRRLFTAVFERYEYIAFLADVEFKNIEFQYLHSLWYGRKNR